ncbi:unnamed protein product [Bursaphelenchus okinawaensis]|uniref:Myosin heavy chain n=1 Tax=Bursaphelenchus okinawaensis TaxID=465554 RepID=A0A811KM46_9BILA|nr:unnamed protein product [Bursaphelenchus okinawaensis]CAG9105813.1 unnamed protein product [Bursaphelenchus okinawaensis]
MSRVSAAAARFGGTRQDSTTSRTSRQDSTSSRLSLTRPEARKNPLSSVENRLPSRESSEIPQDASTSELDYLIVKRTAVADPTMQAEWAQKRQVWVPHEREGFVAAQIKEDNGEMYVVEVVETGQQMKLSKDDCQKMNPPKFDKVEDMADLTCLNEASVLHNLKERYYSDLIYTYSGLFCVVVNPYKRIPIYSEQLIDAFRGKKRHERPPHIFAIADVAYRSMLQEREDQSILCTGESGAGKTENTKKVIQYLAHVAGMNRPNKGSGVPSKSDDAVMQYGELESQLLQANPILEAFGNSKTVKNDNSSRFGKFIRINFDMSGYISGANIDFYLLEKSRCCRQAVNERSFHIFYQFLRGTTPEEKQNYLLEDIGNYSFLNNGAVAVPNVDDAKEFHETIKAMKIMSFSDEEITSILRIISAVMLFGNIKFVQEKKSDQACLADDRVAQKVCHLLGLSVQDFSKAFLKPKIKVGRETVQKAQNKEQAEFSVEAISKASYERMFKWLVQRINKSLDRTRRQGTSFIGILDIAGFEIFEMNSFEQICINYTNEKLQQLFNNTMFILEQEEYQKEGIDWQFIDFGLDLQPTIDLIEKPMGILALLDEQCLFPKATDKSFVEKLTANHEKNSKFVVPEMRSRSDFAVVHYAGRVDYSADKWLMKNMDPLNENVVALMQNSSDPFVQGIWKDAEFAGMGATEVAESAFGGVRTKKGMFRTVSQMYKEQLSKLMSTLRNTSPNFVRCIIPNHEKKPRKIDPLLVLEQLRCNGVLEGIRICRQGFPNRIPFQEFRHRYELLAANVIPRGFMDGKESVKKILDALEIEPNSYRIGMSKVFFRAGVLAKLEEDRDVKITGLIIDFQARCRAFLARRLYEKRVQQSSAIRVLQRNALSWLKLRNWEWWRLFTKVKPLLQVTNQELALQQRDDELKVVREKVGKYETELNDVSQRLEVLQSERSRLQEQLQVEAEERAEVDEIRQRLHAKTEELSELVNDLQFRLEEEEQKTAMSSDKFKKLEENIRDLEEQLESEERKRQKTHLDKNTLEDRLLRMEGEIAELQDANEKLTKERKWFEERANQLENQLVEEEEKTKQANKLRAKWEQQCQEAEGELEKEKAGRQELEKLKRKTDNELQETREVLEEKRNKIEELNMHYQKTQEELSSLYCRSDEENAVISQLQKQLRDYEAQIEEVKDDLENEKVLRSKAEQKRKELASEYETLKSECVDAVDKSQLAMEIQRKKDDELRQLQNQIDAVAQEGQKKVDEVRQKYQRQVEELVEQVEQQKRLKAQTDKSKGTLEQERTDLQGELESLAAQKAETEKRRKQAEAVILDLRASLDTAEQQIATLGEQLGKIQPDYENTQRQREKFEQLVNSQQHKINSLEGQVSETQELLAEETRQKLASQSNVRQLQSEIQNLVETKEEMEFAQQKLENDIQALKAQINDEKKKSEEMVVIQMEEQKKKFQKELENVQKEVEDMLAARDRAERAKKKFQQEVEDLNIELENVRTNSRDADKRQRKFDQQLAEEKANLQKVIAERDALEQDSRDRETRLLGLQNQLEELKSQFDVIEREKRMLQNELEESMSTKDDVGKNVHELERAKRQLEQEAADLRAQVEELEDAVQLAEDARLRIEVTSQGQKNEFERVLAVKEQEDEEKRRSLLKQVRELEEELEQERRSKVGTVGQKKQLEMQVVELQQQLEQHIRQKDDMSKQLKKSQQAIKEQQVKVEEQQQQREEMAALLREAERRMRQAEGEVVRLQEATESLAAQKRKLETERDELEELRTKGGSISSDEKRRLENKIAALQEDVEEGESTLLELQDRLRKAQQQADQSNIDLNAERTNTQQMETEIQSLERQNRELRSQVVELETLTQTRTRAQISSLETQVKQLQDQLTAESSERQNTSRMLRRMEKRVAEAQAQTEEERKSVEQFREASERSNAKARQLRRQVDDLEEEVSRERAKARAYQRQLDELHPIPEPN